MKRIFGNAERILILALTLGLVSACGQTGREMVGNKKPEEKNTGGTESGTKPVTAAVVPLNTGAVSTEGATEASTATASESGSKQASRSPSANSAESGPTNANASVPGRVNINLNDLPSDVPICTVAGNDIKVGDYRRMMRIEQSQANQAIVSDPGAKLRLLAEAKRRGITLTQEEKTKILEASRQQKGMDAKEFQAFLKQTNTSEQQFDNEVILSGLAFKTSNVIIEETLLPELVNRSLLAQAAQEAGGEKEAMNKYLSFKHTSNYDVLLQQTGLSPDNLRDEMVKAELAKIQLGKLEAKAKVSPADVKKIYEQNKAQMKHGERIRLSTILIMCPERDLGPIGSVRTQMAKANPKMSDKELDAATSNYMEQAKQKALILMGQAKAGSDFAKLANENSNDPLTAAKKNGGDMGFIEKKDIIPSLANEVFKLKAGEVLPQLVKSELGYNLYKVTAKEGPGQVKFEEVKDKLELLARQAKMQEVLNNWLLERRKVVKVEFTPKFMAIANDAKGSKQRTQ